VGLDSPSHWTHISHGHWTHTVRGLLPRINWNRQTCNSWSQRAPMGCSYWTVHRIDWNHRIYQLRRTSCVTSPTDDVAAPGLASITMDEICQAQAADILQPVLQLLKDQAKLSHSSLRQYPEDTHLILSQWSGTHCSFKMMSFIVGSIIQMGLQIVCKSSYWPSCTDCTSNGCMPTLVISGGPGLEWSLSPCLLSRVAFFHWTPRSQLCSVQVAPAELPDTPPSYT